MPTTKRLPSAARKLFGERLREVRRAKKMTLEDVSEKADMAWNYIAQVERGERNVGIDNMAALADALEIPLSDLLQITNGKAEKSLEPYRPSEAPS